MKMENKVDVKETKDSKGFVVSISGLEDKTEILLDRSLVEMGVSRSEEYTVSSLLWEKELNEYGHSKIYVGTSFCCSGHVLEYKVRKLGRKGFKNQLSVLLEDVSPVDFNVYDMLPICQSELIVAGSGCSGNGVRALNLNKVAGMTVIAPTMGEGSSRPALFRVSEEEYAVPVFLEEYVTGKRLYCNLTKSLQRNDINPDQVRDELKKYERRNIKDLCGPRVFSIGW
jgi:hypothetical protein